MMRLQGIEPVPFRALPNELRADIKMLWRSYSIALSESEQFLFQIGNQEMIRSSCQNSPVGKKLPHALYLHRSAEEQIGALLRVLIFAARQVVGEPEYNVLKIAMDGKSISFLQYERFDEDGHPALLHSLRVYLPRAEYSIRSYSESSNPPILHRKESLVDSTYANYFIFLELTRQEETHDLLCRNDIGRRREWLELLTERGLAIKDHTVVRLAIRT